jgi:hypothetical protein
MPLARNPARARACCDRSGGGERDPLAFPPPQRELVAGVGVGAAVAAGAKLASDLTHEHDWLRGRVVDPLGHEWEIGRSSAQRLAVGAPALIHSVVSIARHRRAA